MKNSNRLDASRRQFVKASALGILAVPASQLVGQRFTQAQEKLEESDPIATQLNYKHDASQVADAKRTDEAFCYNCQYYQGTQDDEWAVCPLVGGKLVAANGWCNVWVKKAG